ncbi:hypothetical protein HPDFL43_01945 [Hoeflea phototrophica DFL-43]|uniref:DUF4380 domain-containing protein n=1 Tax=Hoeflea phototrophica (strain DSM 17068 / NCIMB 14078 / DFL-43) TaxID=411684 RepID=A9D040_HOEPD|nr:hypothetical protein [Hoeflea phototrophica]EDQ34920.2 hypothetical protein HPDFL43_01945 [Hoeflea phototrophica DFL-43]
MTDRWNILSLKCGDLELLMLPGVGGRLWDVRFQGRSLLFQNPDLRAVAIDLTQLTLLPTRSPQFGFPLWGGEKTWIAPDSAWVAGAPFPELDSGDYAVLSEDDRHILMESKACPVSQFSVRRCIAIRSAHEWTIEHSVTNKGTRMKDAGIWSVMMIDTPAKIAVAMETAGFQPVFGDATALVSKHAAGVVANCIRMQEFKISLPNPDHQTLIKCGDGGPWLLCSLPEAREQDVFAHGHPVEVFNSGDYPYCEAEWHSPMKTLAPGETLNFVQTFHIWANGSPAPAPIFEVWANAFDEEAKSCMS